MGLISGFILENPQLFLSHFHDRVESVNVFHRVHTHRDQAYTHFFCLFGYMLKRYNVIICGELMQGMFLMFHWLTDKDSTLHRKQTKLCKNVLSPAIYSRNIFVMFNSVLEANCVLFCANWTQTYGSATISHLWPLPC